MAMRVVSPLLRPKPSTRREFTKRTSLPVAALLVNFGAPPLEPVSEAGIHKRKEDDEHADGQPRVEARAQRHGVL